MNFSLYKYPKIGILVGLNICCEGDQTDFQMALLTVKLLTVEYMYERYFYWNEELE